MTSPESRAQALADDLFSRGMLSINSAECRALIAQAIRDAENAKLDEAALMMEAGGKFLLDQGQQGRNVRAIIGLVDGLIQRIRSLKSKG
jgi:hypothetical protein